MLYDLHLRKVNPFFTNANSRNKNELTIRRTQTKNEHGKVVIGEITKNDNNFRSIKINNISRLIIEQALKHKIKNKDRLLYCQANGNMH